MVKRKQHGKGSADLFPYNAELACRNCDETFTLEPGDGHHWHRVNGPTVAEDFCATTCPNPECGAPVAQATFDGDKWAQAPAPPDGVQTTARRVPLGRRGRAAPVERLLPPPPDEDDDDLPFVPQDYVDTADHGDVEEPPVDPADLPRGRRVARPTTYEDSRGVLQRNDGVTVRFP